MAACYTSRAFFERQKCGADGKKLAETTKPPVDEKQAESKPAEKKPAARAGGGGLFGALIGVVQGAAQAQAAAIVQVRGSSTTNREEAAPVGLTLLNKGPDLTLEALRKHAMGALKNLIVLRRGNRLSVMPVTTNEWKFIHRLAHENVPDE